MMNNYRIDFLLREDHYTRQLWKGFLAPDIVLKESRIVTQPQLYVLNTDWSSGPGEHWIALFVFPDCCEFFDSFGRSPEYYGLTHTLFNQCSLVYYNKTQYQGLFAKTCGHHVLFYAMHRARGFSHLDMKTMYDSLNLHKNDEMVYDYLFNRFGSVLAHIEDI